MAYADVTDIRMYYEIHGSGSPVVVINGLGADMTQIQSLVDEISATHRVLTFDNRGVGRTDKPREKYTIEQMAADTAGLMRQAGFEKAALVGISMGGRVAIELAATRPGIVERLALVSTAAHVPSTLSRAVILGILAPAMTIVARHRQPRMRTNRSAGPPQSTTAVRCSTGSRRRR